jgi:rRNA maturation endonuclease Nob1
MIAQNQKKNSILIFDTNIFLIGIDFNVIPQKIYTVPEVLEELMVEKYAARNRNIINRINVAIDNGNLIVEEPTDKYLLQVEKSSYKTGDIRALSKADKQLIALALELKDLFDNEVIFYTNDYSIQNCCKELNVRYESLVKRGIRRKINFEVYCPNCNALYDATKLSELCEKCGSLLRRRPILK